MRSCIRNFVLQILGSTNSTSVPTAKRASRLTRRRRSNLEQLEARFALSIGGLGIAGDSLSDEYVNEEYSYALNWVELIGRYRTTEVPLGGYRADEANNWGEPRRKGYEYNWARAGDDSGTLVSHGQHNGLALQIAAGKVTHAVLAIGQNDFVPDGDGAYFNIYSGTWGPAEIEAYADQVVANIETALDVIDTNGVALVMSNIVDYGVAPFTQSGFPDAAKRRLVTDVIVSINNRVRELANQHAVPMADLYRLAIDLLGRPSIMVGGNEVTGTSGPDARNEFVEDGIHPHTVASGIISNVFLQSFRDGYHESVTLFSERELVTNADLTYLTDSLHVDYANYVLLPENPAVTLLAADASFAYLSDITTDGNYFYLTGGDPSGLGGFETNAEIFRLPVAGGAVNVLSGAFTPNEIATDGTFVYWIDPNGDPDATAIFRVPIAGGVRDKI